MVFRPPASKLGLSRPPVGLGWGWGAWGSQAWSPWPLFCHHMLKTGQCAVATVPVAWWPHVLLRDRCLYLDRLGRPASQLGIITHATLGTVSWGRHTLAQKPWSTLTIILTDGEVSMSQASDAGRNLNVVPKPPTLVSVMTRDAVSPTT